MTVVSLSAAARAELEREAVGRGILESCGVLLGLHAPGVIVVERVRGTRNRSAERDSFHCDPGDVVAHVRAGERAGQALVGFWHTHAHGDATPSASDRRGAPPGLLTIVVGGRGSARVRAWRFEGEAAVEVPFAATSACASAREPQNLGPGELQS